MAAAWYRAPLGRRWIRGWFVRYPALRTGLRNHGPLAGGEKIEHGCGPSSFGLRHSFVIGCFVIRHSPKGLGRHYRCGMRFTKLLGSTTSLHHGAVGGTEAAGECDVDGALMLGSQLSGENELEGSACPHAFTDDLAGMECGGGVAGE